MNHLIGNGQIKTFFKQMVEKERLGQSYLFSGPPGVGKTLFALSLAELVIGKKATHHPDVHLYSPEGKSAMHAIDSLRALSEQVYMAPFESKTKFFIIKDAERMLPTSANALLKTFEEPAPDTVIILISSAPEKLLPTILSRCTRVRFGLVEEEEIGKWLESEHSLSAEEAKKLAARSHGSLERAVNLLHRKEPLWYPKLLEGLSCGRMAYSSARELIALMEQEVEAVRGEAAGAIHKEWEEEAIQKNLSATQKAAIEKEGQGAATLSSHHAFDALLEAVLNWYRDLHLLRQGGARSYLFHTEHEEVMFQKVQGGNLLPLESVIRAVEEARQAVQRFLPLSSALETLFLRLALI